MTLPESESNTTSPPIDFDLLDRWIEALRSGKYKQTDGHLRYDDGYCCLGVLCDISGIGSWRESETVVHGYEFVVTRNNAVRDGDLPDELTEAMNFGIGFGTRFDDKPWITFPPDLEEGWSEVRVHRLSELNDEHGYDFAEIADLLERYRDELKAVFDETAA